MRAPADVSGVFIGCTVWLVFLLGVAVVFVALRFLLGSS